MIKVGNASAVFSKVGGKATEDKSKACYVDGDPPSYEGARDIVCKAVPFGLYVVLE